MTREIDRCPGRLLVWGIALNPFVFASGVSYAQLQSLTPEQNSIVERIDSEERISGNAATGLLIRSDVDSIGLTRLWAFLSNDYATTLTLTISSVDGRYHGEARFSVPAMDSGVWLPVKLTSPTESLTNFGFLDGYSRPLDEVAVLLRDEANSVYYPLRWGPSHSEGEVSVDGIRDSDRLLIYVNTERADAFVVEEGRPSMCREASELSGFKFDAICEVSIEEVRGDEPVAPSTYAVSGLRVHRRAGTRSLDPVDMQLQLVFQTDADTTDSSQGP